MVTVYSESKKNCPLIEQINTEYIAAPNMFHSFEVYFDVEFPAYSSNHSISNLITLDSQPLYNQFSFREDLSIKYFIHGPTCFTSDFCNHTGCYHDSCNVDRSGIHDICAS